MHMTSHMTCVYTWTLQKKKCVCMHSQNIPIDEDCDTEDGLPHTIYVSSYYYIYNTPIDDDCDTEDGVRLIFV